MMMLQGIGMVDLEVREGDLINRLYKMNELQKLLSIGKNKAYQLVKIKGFPTIQIGKTIYIPEKELEDWIERNIGNKINL